MLGEFSAYLVATPLVTLMFAFYGRVMPFGALGYVSGALAGFVWSLVAGVLSSWLSQDAAMAALSADAVLFVCHCRRVAGGGRSALSAPVLVGAARAIHNICRAVRADEANSAILHRPEQRDGGSVRSARCISQLEYRSAPAVDHRDCRGNICSPPRMDIPCLCRSAACHRHISTFKGRRRVVHAHTRDGLSRRVERNHFCPVHGSRVSKLGAALN